MEITFPLIGQWKKSKGKIQNFLKQIKMKTYHNLQDIAKAVVKREVYGNKCQYQIRKERLQINNLMI
jgi:hypothetical protein